MIVDQQPIEAHNNGHWYYARHAMTGDIEGVETKFVFLHLSSAIKYAKNKTIPCYIYNQDGVPMKDFSNIHEF